MIDVFICFWSPFLHVLSLGYVNVCSDLLMECGLTFWVINLNELNCKVVLLHQAIFNRQCQMLDILNCLWLSILQLFEVILKIGVGQCLFNKPIKLQDLQVHGCSKARLSEWGIQVLATQRIRISQYLFIWPKYLVKFC